MRYTLTARTFLSAVLAGVFALLAPAAAAQCPTLVGAAASASGSCVGDEVTLTVTGGTNLQPVVQTVDWYASPNPSFSPPAQGTYVGSAAIGGTPPAPCSQPPIVLGGLINPCTAVANTGSNPGSEENEAFFIWSGGGFNAADFGAEVNNNINAGTQDFIGTLGGCALLTAPSVPVVGGCVVFGGPTTVVPPNAFVLVFTSSLADVPLDVSVACALGFPVYVFQSSCSRGSTGNVPGALTNGSGGPYQVEFGCPGPNQSLSYFGVGGNNSSTAGWALGPIGVPAPCNGLPNFPTPPVVSTPTTVDPLTYTIAAGDCPGPLYFSAVVAPPVAGCPAGATPPVQVALSCPEATLSGTESLCVGETSTAVTVSFGGSPPPYTFTYSVDGVPQPPVTTSDNPYVVPVTPTAAGTVTIELVDFAAACPSTVTGTGVLTVTAGGPAEPLDATLCELEQPYDLTQLEDPAYPGGTWSGPGVSGTRFDVGNGNPGSYTVTYTPPAGSGCVTAGDATVTVEQAQTLSPSAFANQPQCGGATFFADILLSAPGVTGTWSGTFYNPSSNLVAISPTFTGVATFTFTPNSGCALPITVSVNVQAGGPAMPLGANVCVDELPLDLTALADPAFPGGTWGGPGVSGTAFDPGASGTYTLTYTPPAGAGCVTAGTAEVTVQATTPLTLANPPLLCEGESFDLDALLPGGTLVTGQWTGPNLTGSIVTPPAGSGGSSLAYTFTPDAGQCLQSASTTVFVQSSTTPTVSDVTVCEGSGLLDLGTLVAPGSEGGTWTGPFVSPPSSFDPDLAGTGTYTLTYTLGSGGCSGTATAVVTVPALLSVPDINLAPACGGTTLELAPLIPAGVPAGGTWNALYLTPPSTVNFPSTLDGRVNFQYIPPGGCYLPVQYYIVVTPASAATPAGASICANEQPYDLTQLDDPSAPGGTWSGPGVVGALFDAGATASGDYTLTYTPPAGAPCVTAGTAVVTVSATQPSILDVATACATAQPIDLTPLLLAGAPGGTWSGANVTGNTFDAGAGAGGSYTVTYTPPASAPCAESATTTVIISTPIPATVNAGTACANTTDYDLTALQPAGLTGGTWSGPGVSANVFDATALGVGTHVVTYTPPATLCLLPTSTAITVVQSVTAQLDPGTVCVGASLDLATLFSAGAVAGSFSGPNVTGQLFDASGAAAGDYTVEFTPSGDCAVGTQTTVTVTTGIAYTLLDATLCTGDGLLDLTTLESALAPGGAWSGTGVVGGFFDPTSSGAGNFVLSYAPAAGSCAQAQTTTVTVTPTNQVALLPGSVCAGDAPLDLGTLFVLGAVPGTWSGQGVSGSTFAPAGLAVGDYVLTFTPDGDCASASTTLVSVTDLSTPVLQNASACAGDGLLDLIALQDPAFPVGTWSGPGVMGTSFDAAAVGVGDATLTYTPAGAGCLSAATTTVTVLANNTPVLTDATACLNDAAFALSTLEDPAFPGGTWSGPGVAGGTFDPAILAAGTYTLTYSPVQTCTDDATLDITVTDGGPVALATATLCERGGFFDLNTLISGAAVTGVWSGPGVTGSTLDPTGFGGDTQTLTFVPSTGCLTQNTTTVTIAPAVALTLDLDTACVAGGPVDLAAALSPGGSSGTWSGANVSTAGILSPDAASTPTTVTYTPTGGCYTSDDFTYDVVEVGELTAGAPTFNCDLGDLTYTATVDLGFTNANGTITTSLGTLAGSILTVANLVAGVSTQVTVSDAATCTADLVVALTTTCAPTNTCTTRAGSFTESSVEACEGEVITVGPPVGTVLDSNDRVAYMLDDDQIHANGVVALYQFDNTFEMPAGGLGQTFYVVMFAGNAQPNNGIDITDSCTQSTQYVPITWRPRLSGTVETECSSDNSTYTATVTLVGGAQDYTELNGAGGAFVGGASSYVLDGVPSGVPQELRFASPSACDTFAVTALAACTQTMCTTDAGTLSGGPFEQCADETLAANPTTGFVDDGDDALVYVLDEDEDPGNGIVAEGTSSAFAMPAGFEGVQLFLYALAGDDDGAGSVVRTDMCLDASNALRVRWYAAGTATAQAPVCDQANGTYTVVIDIADGLAPFSATAATPAGVFSNGGRTYTLDPVATGTPATVAFTSVIGCSTAPLTITDDCANGGCTPPDPGTFPPSPFLLCGTTEFDGAYRDDAVLGPDDLLVFIVYEDAAGTVELGRSATLPIDFATIITPPATVFLAAYAGPDDGSGQIDPACAALSNLREITVGVAPTATRAPTICANQRYIVGDEIFNADRPSGTAEVDNPAGGCDSIITVNLTVLPVPRSTYIDTLCFGEAVTIGNSTFDRDRPSGTVSLLAANGCDSIVTVDLLFEQRARVSIDGPPSFCNPAEVSFTVEVEGTREVTGDVRIGGVDFGAVLLQPGSNTLTYPAQTNFSVFVTNLRATSGGCREPNITTLSYIPTVSLVEAAIDVPLATGGYFACEGGTVQSIVASVANGVGPYSFLWSTGDTTIAINNVGIGTYDVTITDALGCASSADVEVMEADTLAYAVSVDDPQCIDGLGAISISLDELPPGLRFRFDLDTLVAATAADFVFDELEEGTYVFQLVQENGCEQAQLITLDDPPAINLIKRDSFTVELGDSILVEADVPPNTVAIEWTPTRGLACDTCARTLASPRTDVLYVIAVETDRSCIITDQVYVEVLPLAEIFIPTAFSPNGDAVNDVVVPYGGAEVERINSFQVYDRWGERVWSASDFEAGDTSQGWDGTYRGQRMDPAVFVAMVEVLFLDGTVRIFTGDVALVR